MTAHINYIMIQLMISNQQIQAPLPESQGSSREEPRLTRSAAAALVKGQNGLHSQTKSSQPVKSRNQTKQKKKKTKAKRQKVPASRGKSCRQEAVSPSRVCGNVKKDSQKWKQTEERRYLFRYSPTKIPQSPSTDLPFFQGEIEKYYPSSLTEAHLSRIDSLLLQPPQPMSPPINESVQAMFRLNSQDLLPTLVPAQKEHGEVVSVLIRQPKISAMLWFTKEELIEQQGDAVGAQANGGMEEEPGVAGMLGMARVEYVGEEEAMELEKRTVFKKNLRQAVEAFKRQNPDEPNTLNEISQQLLFLTQYLKYKHSQNLSSLSALRSRISQQLQHPYQQPCLPSLYNSYTESVLRKNILRGLQDFQIDTLNYFKLKASLEEHKHYIPNRDMEELKDFINKKRVKRHKKTKLPLATACMGCFSSTYEQVNEIRSCYECGTRAHRICREISNHPCTICESRRTKKIRIRECVLCPNRGYLYRKRGPFNLHVFCLLVFNLFRVQDCTVMVDPDEVEIKPNNNYCICCNSNVGRVVRCQNSDSYAHPLCAFLAGYFMTIGPERRIIIDEEFYNQEELSRFKFNRYYRGNLHKYAYRFLSYEDYLNKMSKKRKGNSESLEEQEDYSGSFEVINRELEGMNKQIMVEQVISFESLISSIHNHF